MRLLIVGTLEGHMTTAGQIALKRGAKVSTVNTIEDAFNLLRGGKGADLVMIDVRLDVGSMVRQLEEEHISVPVVACGIDGTDARTAAASIKAGAREYIPLPPDPDLIAAVLEAVAQESNSVIHSDPAMKAVLKLADQIAPSDASVLITGESGTGKEVMARYIHSKSKRSTGPFIALNCAAIPENLLESELFGHEKGAFSGAVARRLGKFEEANGGTLLLDEVSEMDPRLQAKLLRAIQEREIDRVGGNHPVKIDVRILATSNRDLEKFVREGGFREDLYFRLNVVNIELPGLRERPQDIELLSNHFAAKYAEVNGMPKRPITEGAMAKLKSHGWPGNVRELENTMHRAVLIASGDEIDEAAIMLSGQSLQKAAPAQQPQPAAAPSSQPAQPSQTRTDPEQDEQDAAVAGLVGRTVAEVERDLILDTLSHCLGNRTHAANILGISIRTLRNKLKQYTDEGFDIPLPGEADRVEV